MSPIHYAKSVIQDDMPASFIDRVCNYMPWEYRALFDRLANDRFLTDEQRYQEFARGRPLSAVIAMKRACEADGVPYDEIKLKSNGQTKLLVRAGRILMIQEPMSALYGDRPKVAAYKRELGALHGVLSQLELDLGRKPKQFLDLSECTLAVLLHGAGGPRFNEHDCELSTLMLGVPDDAYENWMVRLDLFDMAWYGSNRPDHADDIERNFRQPDGVIVTRKSKKVLLRSNG